MNLQLWRENYKPTRNTFDEKGTRLSLGESITGALLSNNGRNEDRYQRIRSRDRSGQLLTYPSNYKLSWTYKVGENVEVTALQ